MPSAGETDDVHVLLFEPHGSLHDLIHAPIHSRQKNLRVRRHGVNDLRARRSVFGIGLHLAALLEGAHSLRLRDIACGLERGVILETKIEYADPDSLAALTLGVQTVGVYLLYAIEQRRA